MYLAVLLMFVVQLLTTWYLGLSNLVDQLLTTLYLGLSNLVDQLWTTWYLGLSNLVDQLLTTLYLGLSNLVDQLLTTWTLELWKPLGRLLTTWYQEVSALTSLWIWLNLAPRHLLAAWGAWGACENGLISCRNVHPLLAYVEHLVCVELDVGLGHLCVRRARFCFLATTSSLRECLFRSSCRRGYRVASPLMSPDLHAECRCPLPSGTKCRGFSSFVSSPSPSGPCPVFSRSWVFAAGGKGAVRCPTNGLRINCRALPKAQVRCRCGCPYWIQVVRPACRRGLVYYD